MYLDHAVFWGPAFGHWELDPHPTTTIIPNPPDPPSSHPQAVLHWVQGVWRNVARGPNHTVRASVPLKVPIGTRLKTGK